MPQWSLAKTRSLTETLLPTAPGHAGDTSVFVFEMEVRRQGSFGHATRRRSAFLVVILSRSVFWLDRASLGGRMSVPFFGLLTAVACRIVPGDIPPHISYLTPVNVFVNLSFMSMCASIVVNLVVGELNREGRSAEADTLDNRCKTIFPAVCLLPIALTVSVFALVF